MERKFFWAGICSRISMAIIFLLATMGEFRYNDSSEIIFLALQNMIAGTIDCTVEYSFWPRLGAGVPQNFGNFVDEVIEEARAEADAAGLDLFAQTRPMKRIFPYILEQAYKLTLTSPYWYIVWQPWVQGYNGSVFNLQLNSYKGWVKYAWIDQGLKYDMTGQQ